MLCVLIFHFLLKVGGVHSIIAYVSSLFWIQVGEHNFVVSYCSTKQGIHSCYCYERMFTIDVSCSQVLHGSESVFKDCHLTHAALCRGRVTILFVWRRFFHDCILSNQCRVKNLTSRCSESQVIYMVRSCFIICAS